MDKSRVWVAVFWLGLACPIWPGEVVVDASRTCQVIRGFGASSAWISPKISDSLAQMFFDPESGIGLSMLRTRIPPDWNWDSEVPAMRQARAWGVTQIWSSEWTPPPSYKSNRDPNHGGTLLPEHYQDYADYLVRYVQDLKTHDQIDLFALSPQNEPDYSTDYESCLWSGEAFRIFVRDFLGPAFKAHGITAKIVLPESYKNDLALSDPSLDDPAAAGFVGVLGEHLYGGGPLPYSRARDLGKEYWETEVSDFKSFDRGMASGLKLALQVHRCLSVDGMNAYHYWWLVPGGNKNDNEALTDAVGGATKRLYCLGNFSKFIRPGFFRVETTPGNDPDLWVSAYSDATSGRFVVVAVNNGNQPLTKVFRLEGMTPASVTPWVTDEGRDLEKQPGLALSEGAFTYVLPPLSVVTLNGQASHFVPTATPTPTPPASLSTANLSCLVDDLEQGGKVNRWGGTWGTYSGPRSHVDFGVEKGGSPLSPTYCASAKGSVSDYGGMTCPLGGAGLPVNLSRYSGVCFYTKGNGSTYWFQATIPSIQDGDHYGKTFQAGPSWKPVTLRFDEMSQRNFGASKPFTPDQVILLQWGNSMAGEMDFQVDDVRLLGADCPPMAVPAPARVPANLPLRRLDPNSMAAHQQLLEKAKKGRIDIYFEGDSIVRRWGATDYPELLDNWKRNFFGWNAADFGWGADLIQNILWRLQNGELDGVNPKVIVLLAGTNNAGDPSPGGDNAAKIRDITGGFEALLGTMRDKAPDAVILLTAIFPRNDNPALMPLIEGINENLSRLADGKKIRFLNINDRLADKNGKLFEGMMNADRLHPALQGYQVWADALKPLLTELLGPPGRVDQAPPATGDPSLTGVKAGNNP